MVKRSSQSMDNRPSGKLSFVYYLLSVGIVPFTLCVLIGTFILDLLPYPYFSPFVESIFMFEEMTPLMSAVLVVWTFSASLVVFFLGKMSERCFGIHISEAMLTHEEKGRLLAKSVLFLLEIALLAGFATYGFRISFVALCLIQLLNMGYIFLMVNLETSRNHVTFWVNDEIKRALPEFKKCSSLQQVSESFEKKSADWLLLKILQGINYESPDEMEFFESQVLRPLFCEYQGVTSDMQLVISFELVVRMIAYGCYNMETGINLRTALRDCLTKIIRSNDYPEQVRNGVFAAIMIRFHSFYGRSFFSDLVSQISSVKVLSWCNTLGEKLTKEFIITDIWSQAFKDNPVLRKERCELSADETIQMNNFLSCYGNTSFGVCVSSSDNSNTIHKGDEKVNV